MQLAANIFDVWVFRRRGTEVEFLLLYTSVEKATRYFNGGRFWQIPSNLVKNGESITDESFTIVANSGEVRISSGKKKHGVLRPA